MHTVIISILHFNNDKDTFNCLNSLLDLNLSGINLKTYVLDNGSKQALELPTHKYDTLSLTVIRNPENSGFTGGHNLVFGKVEDMDFDYFMILNNDTIVEKNLLKELVVTIQKEEVGAVVPKIYFTRGHEYHKDRYSENDLGKVFWYAGGYMDWDNVASKHRGVDEVDHGQFCEEEEIGFATGACLLMRKKLIKKIGLFDEKYFLYYEDADLTQRIQKSGYKIFYNPKAILWHNNAGSSSSGSALHDYYLTRNRLLFGMTYAPLKTRLFLLKESAHLLRKGRVWQKKGVKDYYFHKLGKGSYE
jgi:GT2 family glycosyltransferase